MPLMANRVPQSIRLQHLHLYSSKFLLMRNMLDLSSFLELRLLAVGCSLIHLNLKLDSACVLNGFKTDDNGCSS